MKKWTLVAFSIFSALCFAQQRWTLKECVEYAAQNNLQIKGYRLNKNLQEKNLEIAKRQRLPYVNASVGNSGNFGSQQFGTTVQRNDYYTNNISLNGGVDIYNAGRLQKNIRKTEFDVQASEYDVQTITNNISLQIAQQYLNVLLNKEIVKIAESAYENAQKLYNRAKITTEVGTTAQTVLAEAESALARENQNLKNAEINTGRSLFALAQLLQLQDYRDFDIVEVDISKEVTAPEFSADAILEKAYAEQPQIAAAQYRIRSAEQQTLITRTAFYPTLGATAGIGSFYNTQSPGDYGFYRYYKDNFSQQIGLNLSVPIFNKGITRVQVEQSKINEEIAKNNLESEKFSVRQSVQQAEYDARANYENYLAALQAEKAAALSLDFATKSEAAGRTTIFDLNTARNNYANAAGTVAQAKYNYLFSVKLLNFYNGIPVTVD